MRILAGFCGLLLTVLVIKLLLLVEVPPRMDFVGGLLVLTYVVVFFGLHWSSPLVVEVDDQQLRVRWRLFRIVPFRSKRVSIASIREVRRMEWKDTLDPFPIPLRWGNPFDWNAIVVDLRRGIARRLIIYTREPEVLLDLIAKRLPKPPVREEQAER